MVEHRHVRWCTATGALVMVGGAALFASPAFGAPKPYMVRGTYVEGCSCPTPCPCEMVGLRGGCEGVGAMMLSGGRYEGVNLAGTKMAYAVAPGKWVRLYVDAPDSKRAAVSHLAQAIFSAWGKVEAVDKADIAFSGGGGWYKVAVNGGKTLSLTTKPVMGGDQRRPVRHDNVKSALTTYFLQGVTTGGHYMDGGHKFELKGSNSYFYPVNHRGKV